MNAEQRAAILELMASQNTCTLATVRSDGYPQATTVAYANEGLEIYLACDRDAQKLRNIRHCPKVSLTIDQDYVDWRQIRGLSLGGKADILGQRHEREHAFDLLSHKFPEMNALGKAEDLLYAMAFLRITPEVISLLDYTQGFGHTELVRL